MVPDSTQRGGRQQQNHKNDGDRQVSKRSLRGHPNWSSFWHLPKHFRLLQRHP